MSLSDILDFFGQVLRSDFALALLLLGLLFMTNRKLTRFQRTNEVERLACEAALILTASHRDTFKNIAGQYRMLYIGGLGNNRAASPELMKIDENYYSTRRAVHDHTQKTAQKLHDSIAELQKHIEEDFL